MNRTKIYVFSLVGFFLMWGIFGFAAAAPRSEVDLQETVPPNATASAGIPVTGEPERVWTEIVGFYGLLGIAALCLILAMLSFANQSTAPYGERNPPPSEETHKN